MKNLQQTRNYFSSYGVKAVLLALISVSGLSVYPASGQNPWLEESKPLIDESDETKIDVNSWAEKHKLEGSIDE